MTKTQKESRIIHGIICIDKPEDHTSFDVIARVRGILRTRKVGHGGTLDPMATGVLPIFLGHATRCCDILPVGRKRYTAGVRLGMTTDTLDRTGKVTAETGTRVTRAALEEALRTFGGGYDQLPPMYSAIQIGGQRLYDLARQGVEVERDRRYVELHQMEISDFDEERQTFTLDVECGKGTYVRTLCADIAQRCGTLGMLASLRRTMSAGFTLEECVTLEELADLAARGREQERILPVSGVFSGLPRVHLAPVQTRMLLNGVKIDAARCRTKAREGLAAIYDGADDFIATGIIDPKSGLITGVKLFCDRGGASAQSGSGAS